MDATWCSSGNKRRTRSSRIDLLFASVIEAVTSDSTEKVDDFVKSSARGKRAAANRSQWESSFCHVRRKILESVENRKHDFKDSSHAKQIQHKSSEKNSSKKRNCDQSDSTRRKHLSQPGPSTDRQVQDVELKHLQESTAKSKNRVSTKEEWISTLKEMADPKNELTSSSSPDLLDLSQLDVQTTALPEEDSVVAPSCSQVGSPRHDSPSTTTAEPERDSTSHTKRRRNRRRRSKGNKCQQVLYTCSSCESPVLVRCKSPSDRVRCLHCDYWTAVEPEFVKDEKMEQNFCKIA